MIVKRAIVAVALLVACVASAVRHEQLSCWPGYTWYDYVSEGEVSLGSEDTPLDCTFASDGPLYAAVDRSIPGEIEVPRQIDHYALAYVGPYAFCGCTNITSVIIPNGVKSIGRWAFAYCNKLKSVAIPEGVGDIGLKAFMGCVNLESIEIPASVTNIGASAFYNCPKLKSIAIAGQEVKIGESAFTGCSGLADENGFVIFGDTLFCYAGNGTNVHVPSGIRKISSRAFSGCSSLVEIHLPETVDWIGDSAFANCKSLTVIDAPCDNPHVGIGVFKGCSGLANEEGLVIALNEVHDYVGEGGAINIPEGVNKIGNEVFRNSSITSVVVSTTVKSIGLRAFYNSRQLKSLVMPSTLIDMADDAFSYCDKLADGNGFVIVQDTLFGYIGNKTNVTIPDGIIRIGYKAFPGGHNIRSVEMPSSVVSIGASAFSYCYDLTSVVLSPRLEKIGFDAFSGCSSLCNIQIPNSVTNIDTSAFLGCRSLKEVAIPDSVRHIGESAFRGCYGLTNVSMGAVIECIPPYLFAYTGISQFSVPNGVKEIGSGAFSYCSNLVVVSLPQSLSGVDSSAFYNCAKLQQVDIPDGVREVGNSAFRGCSRLTSVIIGQNVERLGLNAFYDCDNLRNLYIKDVAQWCEMYRDGILYSSTSELHFYLNGELMSDLVVPEGVKRINREAFLYCKDIKSVTVPDSVTLIGDNAFCWCDALETVVGMGGVKEIGKSAFSVCSNLTSIAFGDTLESIGYSAFSRCSKLNNIVLPDAIASIGDYAFSSCNGLSNIKLGGNVRDIGDYAFYYCRRLNEIVVPNSVTNIGANAFYYCTGLLAARLSENIVALPDRLFYMCTGLTNVVLGSSVVSIGRYAFNQCRNLRHITLPVTITEIDETAFNGCRNLLPDFYYAVPNNMRGLIAYYKFDGDCSDSSQNANGGTAYGVTFTEDRNGNRNGSCCFGNGNFIQVPNSDSLNSITNELTFTAWIRIDDWYVTGQRWAALFSKGNYQYCFNLTPDSSGYRTEVASSLGANFADAVPVKEWVHVAVIFSDDKVCRSYVNGMLYATVSCPDASFPSSTEPLYIGKHPPLAMEYFNGAMDELRIYNRALSADEIRSIYDTCDSEEFVALSSPTASGKPTAEVLFGNDVFLSYGFSERFSDESATLSNVVSVIEEQDGRVVAMSCDVVTYDSEDKIAQRRNWRCEAIQGLAPGKYEVEITLNAARKLDECDFANNIFKLPLTVVQSVEVRFADALDGSGDFVRRYKPGFEYSELPTMADRDGLRFSGWSSDDLKLKLVRTKDIVPEEGITLYAYWTPGPKEVWGTLTTNTTWHASDLYLVKDNFTVASGVTLTIEPGTIIKFAEGKSLTVNSGATLNAIGTRAQPIVFTSIKDDEHGGDTNGDGEETMPPDLGEWSKICVNGGTANFDYVHILYSSRNSTTGAISMPGNGGKVTFNNGEIAHCAYDAVGVETGNNFYMTNSVIRDSLLAFRHWARDPIVNCVIYDCGRLTQGGGQHFVNCVFSRITETWEAFGFPNGGTTYRNCCFWNEDGSVLHQQPTTSENWGAQDAMTVCGKDGNIWGDPRFLDPGNGDFRLDEKSLCVDAGLASAAPATDCFGQPRINAPDIGICEVMPRNVTSDIDLIPQSVTADAEAVSGRSLTVNWTVVNQGGADANIEWRDTVSLVSENGRIVTLGDKVNTKRLIAGGTISCSASFIVPAIAEGKWYPKVNVNSARTVFEGALQENNVLTGETAVNVSTTTLDLSVANEGVINAGTPTVLKLAFDATNDNRMVKFDVPAGVTITWGFGFMPTSRTGGPSVQSGSINGTGDSPVLFRVPDDTTDVYVVLESNTAAAYNFSTETTKMAITSVSPTKLSSSGTTTLTITGAGFSPTNEIHFINGGAIIAPESMQYINSQCLVASVDGKKFNADQSYTLEVVGEYNTAQLDSALSVIDEKGEGHFWAELCMPDRTRAGRETVCQIKYGNDGNADIPVQILQVTLGTGNQGKLAYVDSANRFDALQFVAAGDREHAGVIRAGAEHCINFIYIPGGKSSNRKETVLLHSSWGQEYHRDGWDSAERYVSDMSWSATRIALIGKNPTDYGTVYERAVECHGNGYTSAIRGVLRTSGGEGVGNEVITLVNQETTNYLAAVSDAAGCFVFDNLYPGLYVLTFQSITNVLSLSVSESSAVAQSIYSIDMSMPSFAPSLIVNFPKGEFSSIILSSIASTNNFTHVTKFANDTCVKFYGLQDGAYKIIGTGGNKRGVAFAEIIDGMITEIELYPTDTCIVYGRLPNNIESDDSLLLGFFQNCEIVPIEITTNADFRIENIQPGEFSLAFYIKSQDILLCISNTVQGCESFDVSALLQDAWDTEHCSTSSRLPPRLNVAMLKNGSTEFEDSIFWSDRLWVYDRCRIALNLIAEIGEITPPTVEEYCPHSDAKYKKNIEARNNLIKWNFVMNDLYQRTSNIELWKLWCDAGWEAGKLALLLKTKGVSVLTGARIDAETAINNWGFNGVVYNARTELLDMAVGSGAELMKEEIENLLFEAERRSNTIKEQFQAIVTSLSNPSFSVEYAMNLKLAAKTLENLCDLAYLTENVLLAYPGSFTLKNKIGTFQMNFNSTIDGTKKIVQIILSSAIIYANFVIALDKAMELDALLAKMRSKMIPFQQVIQETEEAAKHFYPYVNCCKQCFPNPPYYPPRTNDTYVGGSEDPNEMAGPIGLGDPETERFVKPGEWMTYTIYFENKTNATADAQEVYVTNPLSEWLDWSTFEMGEIAFGNQIDLGLSGKNGGTCEATMKGTNFIVRTWLSGDAQKEDDIAKTGVAHWYMRIVDPATKSGWPLLAGFLPPNDETFRGEGHLTYRIKVRDDAPAGLVITNSASIVFDMNDPIETDPAWWNTVAPTVGLSHFAKCDSSVKEGSNAVIRVMGGNVYTNSSVKVYLTYNTAAAADVDLGKMKFPITLNWEAGEIGEKVVEIPVKTDKTVEDDEFFTLQLGDAQGMALGEDRVCTVTIRDPGYAELADKIAAGTASKAEITAWNKLQAAKAPYVRGLADPAEAGKVTGSGLCAAGKKVTLKATANKGWVFMGWRGGMGNGERGTGNGEWGTGNGFIATTPTLVIDRGAKPAKDSATSTTVTNVAEDATFYASYITVEEDKAAITLDMNGVGMRRVEDNAPYQTNVLCGVYLEWPVAASALSATTVKVSGLPAGLKFADKPVTAKVGTGRDAVVVTNIPANTIYGAPSAASKTKTARRVEDNAPYQEYVPSEVKITVTTAGKSSVTYLAKLTVEPLPAWAVGGFEGVADAQDDQGESAGAGRQPYRGSASMSVAANGKVSGKIALDGTNWTFKADSLAAVECRPSDVGDAIATNLVVAATATAGKETREIALAVAGIAAGYLPDSATALAEGTLGGGGRGATALPDGGHAGRVGDAWMRMWRLPWTDKDDTAPAKLIATLAGAYACKIAYGDAQGDVTFTLDGKGAVKGTAVLPDGTKTRKATFAANALPMEDDVYVAIILPPDAKKGYPAVCEVRKIVGHSGEDAEGLVFRAPGVIADVASLNDGTGASGTVTVNPKYGQVAAGKDVTLTAKADKASVFSGWAVTGVGTEGLDLASATLKFKSPGTHDVFATAKFVTRQEDKDAITLEVDGVGMRRVGDNVPYQVTNYCGVAVAWPVVSGGLSATTVKVTGLPAGLKLAQDKTTKTYSVTGVPTAASKTKTVRRVEDNAPYQEYVPSAVTFAVTTEGKSTETFAIDLVVLPLPEWAVGTFDGGGRGATALPDGGHAGGVTLPSGIVSLTIDAKGKIGGKLLESGMTWTLSAPWFDTVESPVSDVEEPSDGSQQSEVLSPAFRATVIGKSGKEAFTNAVTVAMEEVAVAGQPPYRRGVVNALAARSTGGTGGSPVQMEWVAWQNLWKAEPWKSLGKLFDKRTLTYAIRADGTFVDGDEAVDAVLGEEFVGRVTLKFAANGTVAVAGEFVTGYNENTKRYATVKATGSATLVPMDEESCKLFIYLAPKGLSPHARGMDVPWPKE